MKTFADCVNNIGLLRKILNSSHWPRQVLESKFWFCSVNELTRWMGAEPARVAVVVLGCQFYILILRFTDVAKIYFSLISSLHGHLCKSCERTANGIR
jgi:hypothetical protein